MDSLVYLGSMDGSKHHTQNLALDSWIIYAIESHAVSSGGMCLWPSSNNVAKYIAMIELLQNTISNGNQSLEVRLDSHLVVSQLNGLYHIKDPTLLQRFLQVRYG